jgi:hypothetical protein
MVRDCIVGVVVEETAAGDHGSRTIIFDDEAWFDFYSSQTLNQGKFFELTGVNALYRTMRETAVCYEA